MKLEMLVDKNEFQLRDQLLEHIHNVNHLDASFYQVIGATGKITRQHIDHRLGYRVDMDESPGLVTVTVHGKPLLEVGIEYKFIDDGIETHAPVVAIHISAAEDIGIYFTHEPAHVLFAP